MALLPWVFIALLGCFGKSSATTASSVHVYTKPLAGVSRTLNVSDIILDVDPTISTPVADGRSLEKRDGLGCLSPESRLDAALAGKWLRRLPVTRQHRPTAMRVVGKLGLGRAVHMLGTTCSHAEVRDFESYSSVSVSHSYGHDCLHLSGI